MTTSCQPLISLDGVTKVFYTDEVETHALAGIHLEIQRGDYVAIAGPSGCGKSTLLSILGLLDSPTDGVYQLNGGPVQDLDLGQRARIRNREIGFIFQSFNLIGDLTVFENVELPLTYRGMAASERKSFVTEALERVGMAHRAKHLPSQLSGGQQQRVAVARALAGRPAILLADEPTGNLDSRNGEAVMQLLKELHENGATICMVTHDEGFDPFGSSLLEFEAYRQRNHSFESIGVAMQRSFNLLGRGEPERIRGASIMADYLTTLGVKPVLGRGLTVGEDQPGGPAVALIGYGFWQKHFGGNPRVIGEKLNLEGRSYTVIGVMAPGFDLPEAAEIWVPLQTKIDSLPFTDRAIPGYEVVAKLRQGVTLKQADAESKSIARQLEQEFPQVRRGWSVKLIWLRQALLGDLAGRVNKALLALVGGVGFLLLISCANVANLQLARGIARTRELALRRALGASRRRLILQLLIESMLLALLGGAAGLLLAHWIVPLLGSINPFQGISLVVFFCSV